MMKTIIVAERGSSELSVAEWSALQGSPSFWRLVADNVLTVTTLPAGAARLNGFNLVGRALCDGVVLECREKIPGALRALLMAGKPTFSALPAPTPTTDLGETIVLIVHEFIASIRAYVSSGRQWEYVNRRSVSSLGGGRLYVPATVQLRARGLRHLATFDRSAISHAIPINQLCYAALREVELLAKLVPVSSIDLSAARTMALFFEDCRDSTFFSRPSTELAAQARVLLDTTAPELHVYLLELASVLLSHASFEPTEFHDEKVPFSWFVNLERLFEAAVRCRLDAITSADVAVSKSTTRLVVFPQVGKLNADPDIVVRTPRTTIIGDVKYKDWSGSPTPSDLYQLLVHAETFDTDLAFLIYPSGAYDMAYLGRSATGVRTWLFAVDVRDMDTGLEQALTVMGVDHRRVVVDAVADEHTDGVRRRSASWASSPATRASMRANRRRDTRPELAIRSILHADGLRYRVDARPLPELPRRADLVFPRARVAVFIDGCFWHGCPTHHTAPATNKEYWVNKIERNKARDRETNELLRSAGWTVLRVWEHEDPRVAASHVADQVRAAR